MGATQNGRRLGAHARPFGPRTIGPLLAAGLLTLAPAAAFADGSGGGVQIAAGECTFPSKLIPGTPWALRRVLLPDLADQSTGKGVKVAVIDTGVDVTNPQLASAVSIPDGLDVLDPHGNGTKDDYGHGTKVAGIIAARPLAGTGFVGLAPDAQIIAIRQNDGRGNGNVAGLITALGQAVAKGAKVINISQDTATDQDPVLLHNAINSALAADVVIVAAAGNDGASGTVKATYPASYPGVLAVAASDRNNERASFSQPGSFVGIAAPGVDIVSTVPAGGHCLDQGTSFAAPYVAAVAALIRAKHPTWTAKEVIAQIEQTAQRTDRGHNDFVGWGVVDPVTALTRDTTGPIEAPTPDAGLTIRDNGVTPIALPQGETPSQRRTRYATYVVGTGALLATLIAGTAIVLRDRRRGPISSDKSSSSGRTVSQQARLGWENGELEHG